MLAGILAGIDDAAMREVAMEKFITLTAMATERGVEMKRELMAGAGGAELNRGRGTNESPVRWPGSGKGSQFNVLSAPRSSDTDPIRTPGYPQILQ